LIIRKIIVGIYYMKLVYRHCRKRKFVKFYN